MSFRNITRRVASLSLTSIYVLIILAASLTVLPVQKASAELVPLPEPTASTTTPSGGCQWMGEFHTSGNSTVDYHDTYDNLPYTSTAVDTFNYDGVTAQVPGKTCGYLYNGETFSQSFWEQSAFCTLGNTTDLMSQTTTMSASGSGSGELFTFFVAPQNYLGINANANDGTSYHATTFTTCNEAFNSTHTEPWGAGVNVQCYQAGWTSTGFNTTSTAQATVGSCSYDNVFNYPDGKGTIVQHYETSWRMRKINCDPSVNTDGGIRNDCQEYEDKTDPTNASDDLVSAQTQAVLDIAAEAEQQCLGQVAKLGAKDAAAGKGVKGAFEYWNLLGVPGVTTNSTFQQKMDAVRDYCKVN